MGLLLQIGCRKPRENQQTQSSARKATLSAALTHGSAVGSIASPMVRAEVRGNSTLLIVDTGATYHAFEASFARKLGAAVDAKADARNHVGELVQLGAVDNVTMQIGGAPAVRNATIPVVPSSESLQRIGVGGVLSPQSLAPPGFTVVLDLQHDRLAVLTGALGVGDRVGPGQSLAPDGMRACRIPKEPNHRYVLSLKVDGLAATFEVDTGSAETHVFADSPLGRALAPRVGKTERRGSIGGEYEARWVPGVQIVAGEVRRTLDVLLIPGAPPPECPFDGMVGMDILGTCTLAFDDNSAIGRCSQRTSP